jgi:hypothetical protein
VNRTVGSIAAVLFFGAALSFVLGMLALRAEEDFRAVYWLLAGALAWKSSADLVQRRSP